MVKTGARAAALGHLLGAIGYKPASGPAPKPPRLRTLPPDLAESILCLHRGFGGVTDEPKLRPGAWDLAFADGLVVELDEELHFNRYRARTLLGPWAEPLPWRSDHLAACAGHESDCLAAGGWGKRWTNPSSAAMFGGTSGPGVFVGAGASRWKQRALYDAMKDAAAASATAPDGLRLARLATHDVVAGVPLGPALLDGRPLDLDALAELVDRRTTTPTGPAGPSAT